MTTLSARGTWVIVERVPETGGIIEVAGTSAEDEKAKAIVVSVGSEVKGLSEGDQILFVIGTQHPLQGKDKTFMDGKKYDAVQQQTIICVLQHEADVAGLT